MRTFFVVGLLVLVPLTAIGQGNRLINTHDWPYEVIERLQSRGHLLTLNPTALPYTIGEVRQALRRVDTTAMSATETKWHRQLAEAVAPREPNVDSMRVGGVATAGARRSSSKRLNVLEPVGDGEPALPRVQLQGYLEWGPWIGQAGSTFDWFYETDPDGLDTARRLYGRSEEVYVGYNSERVDVYLGRFDNHWSMHDHRGAFLTDNPRSFDQIQFRLGNSTLSFESILGVLDNMSPDSTFTGMDRGRQGVTRRYAFFHRLDWSPTPALKLSLIEGEIYHSPTASLSLRNLIPLHTIFLESANVPRNADSNAMIGGSIWYQPGPLTIYVQGMLDDILLTRREERKRTGEFYPAIYTVNGSVTWADVFERVDLGAEVDLVSLNSYRARDRAEEWSYVQRGLATNFSDYVRSEVHATWYPTAALEVEPALTLYRKGEGDFRRLQVSYDPGPGGAIPSVLSGTVERTVRPSLSVRYQPIDVGLFGDDSDARFHAWLDVDAGVNFIEHADHKEDVTDRRFVGLVRVFGQVSF